MALICPKCGSADTQAAMNSIDCLGCGRSTPVKDLYPKEK